MARKTTFHYFSITEGIEANARKGETYYVGFMSRIPAQDFPGKLKELAALDVVKVGLCVAQLPEGQEAGQVVERYEVYDADTGDILVMYRIPVHKKAEGTWPFVGLVKGAIH